MNKFRKIDFTKKIVIIFITFSFLCIFGTGLYNSIEREHTQNSSLAIGGFHNLESNSIQQVVVENQEVTDTNNQQNSNQETIKKKVSSQNSNENKKNTSSKSNSSINNQKDKIQQSPQNTQSNQNNQSKDEETVDTVQTISVHVQVIGMGNTMMSGIVNGKENHCNAYSVLVDLAKENGSSVSGSSSYVTGIGGLNEKEHGSGSGWMYKVNGVIPNKPAKYYNLKNNDRVVWYYVNYE